MARKNIRKIVLGMFLIGLALMSAAIALYFLRIKPTTTSAPVAVEQTAAVIPPAKSHTEGFLWFDRGAEKWVATVGFVDGLRSGSPITVYEHDVRVGTVVVDTVFSGSAYVNPGPDTTLTRQYYQVRIEK